MEIEAQPGRDIGAASPHQVEQRGADVAAAQQPDSYRKSVHPASLPAVCDRPGRLSAHSLCRPHSVVSLLFMYVQTSMDLRLLLLGSPATPDRAVLVAVQDLAHPTLGAVINPLGLAPYPTVFARRRGDPDTLAAAPPPHRAPTPPPPGHPPSSAP